MANLSRPSSTSPGVSRRTIIREPVQGPSQALRRAALVLAGVAVLAALAWLDGGEQPLRPMAQDIDMPEPGR